jgi:desulfoferrodoxin (superoxide reductase-like protein)
MQRRLFIKSVGLVSVSALVTAPQIALAETVNPMSSPLAGSLYYTQASPGRWAGKEGGHVPTIERNGNSIQATTGHEMNGHTHYIIKHIMLNNKLEFVTEKLFDPANDSPISEHDIKGMNGTVYVVSLCNKHDAWLSQLRL